MKTTDLDLDLASRAPTASLDRAPAPDLDPDPDPDPTGVSTGSTLPDSRIQLINVIGSGATSFVFRGEHIDLQRPLAVKVQRTNITWPNAKARFLDEARMTCGLDSPFVVDVVDAGALPDGRLWTAMEFLDGHSLADELDEGRLSVERAIGLLRMACKGLHAAHQSGIVHRDVKPANMMVVQRRGRDHLVIVDFGVAVTNARTADECCGTPGYMAPEQIEQQPLDARADIYALGCCAYEMLTGERLARGDSVEDVLGEHVSGLEVAFPPDADVPLPLRAVVERCVANDPAARFASMAQLEAALVQAQLDSDLRCWSDRLEPPDVEDHGMQRRLASALARPRRRPSAPQLGALSAGLLTFALIGMAAWAGHDAQSSPSAPVLDADSDAHAVRSRVRRARQDAAASRFVYPHPGGDTADTAYHAVLEIEGWQGPAHALAQAEARQLREDFSEQLEARADAVWDDPVRRDEARDLYEQALIFTPDDAELRARLITEEPPASEAGQRPPDLVPPASDQPLMSRAKARPTSPPDMGAGEHVRAGQEAWDRGQRRRARDHFEAALQLDADNAAAYAGLADMLTASGRDDAAVDLGRKAVHHAPTDAALRIRLGDAYARLGAIDRATDQFERADELGSSIASGRLAHLQTR